MTPAPDSHDAPRTVVEPTTGRPVLMAPLRQQRPMHTGARAVAKPCPFCPGNERETPPECDAERDADTRADRPGWIARAFPNKYPANLHHEVIAEGAAHTEHPCDLDLATWRRCVVLWQRRIAALETRPGVTCAYFFKNVGAAAGASIAHNHSQVLGLAELPPRLALERDRAAAAAACPWCATLASADADGRLVFADDQHAVLAPDPPKLPFETWLVPRRCGGDFVTADAGSVAAALLVLFRALGGALDRPPCNLWLHRVPAALAGARPFHWHFELQPRTGQLAGLELGGDMYINSMPAAAAAARLRAGLAAS